MTKIEKVEAVLNQYRVSACEIFRPLGTLVGVRHQLEVFKEPSRYIIRITRKVSWEYKNEVRNYVVEEYLGYMVIENDEIVDYSLREDITEEFVKRKLIK